MNKLIVFFLFMLIGCGILVGIVAGGGGVVTTTLAADVNAENLTLNVTDTTDFLSEDYVIIGNEKIFYTGKTTTLFTGCTRGYDDTVAIAHSAGAAVYTAEASSINYALGFNIVAVQDQLGWAAIIAIPFMFFVRTIPQIMRMTTALLTGDLAIISWFFYAMVAGFIVTLAMSIIGSRRVI